MHTDLSAQYYCKCNCRVTPLSTMNSASMFAFSMLPVKPSSARAARHICTTLETLMIATLCSQCYLVKHSWYMQSLTISQTRCTFTPCRHLHRKCAIMLHRPWPACHYSLQRSCNTAQVSVFQNTGLNSGAISCAPAAFSSRRSCKKNTHATTTSAL